MPGLIDAHWHSFLAATSMPLLTTANPSYLHLLATRQAEATLMRGFTTVRDMGGPVFGLKRAIDEGAINWPAHLSFRGNDLADVGTWRRSVPLRGSTYD